LTNKLNDYRTLLYATRWQLHRLELTGTIQDRSLFDLENFRRDGNMEKS